METITLKPIEVFFCNKNKSMGLTPHCHYGEVVLQFETLAEIGFPSFKDTFQDISDFVQGLPLKPFTGTNEDVMRFIYEQVDRYTFPTCENKKGVFRLYSLVLKVMGVQDENNHANGFTTYEKTKDPLTKQERHTIHSYNAEKGDEIYTMPLQDYLKTLRARTYNKAL